MTDKAVAAARAYLERCGGTFVTSPCPCGEDTYAAVRGSRIVGYVRSCNCDEPGAATEARVIAAARAKAA